VKKLLKKQKYCCPSLRQKTQKQVGRSPVISRISDMLRSHLLPTLQHRSDGFTRSERRVVMVVIGWLASIAVAQYFAQIEIFGQVLDQARLWPRAPTMCCALLTANRYVLRDAETAPTALQAALVLVAGGITSLREANRATAAAE
jgi:hypothetical protein